MTSAGVEQPKEGKGNVKLARRNSAAHPIEQRNPVGNSCKAGDQEDEVEKEKEDQDRDSRENEDLDHKGGVKIKNNEEEDRGGDGDPVN